MKRTKSDYDRRWNKESVQDKRIVKIYDYTDEQGELLFEAIRYAPKAFRQRRPDGAGGYIWNLKDTRRVLYRLPELIKGKDPVFILEGEKDVDNLREWGLTATTCPMGAEKWKSQQKEYNPFLKEREVIIIPDNDEEGERHLSQVVTSLQGIAKSVKVLRLPGAKDFSEWREKDKSNTEEKFLTLLSEAQEWKQKGLLQQAPPISKATAKKFTTYQEKVRLAAKTLLTKSYSGYDLSRTEFKQEQFWISNGLLPKRGFVLLAAHKGRGKTTLTLQMCLKLIQGNTTFLRDFELKDSPGKILYCYAENEPAELKLIKETQEQSAGIKLSREQNESLIFQPRERLDLVDPNGIAVFEAALDIIKPDIVIFDPVHRFLAGQDINKLQNINKFFDTLTRIENKCLWFFISHLRKPSSQDTGSTIYKVMGSSAFVNNCDTVITLDRADPHRDPLCSLMEITTRRARLIQDTYIKLNEETRSLEVIEKSDLQQKKVVSAKDIQKDLREMGGTATPSGIVEFARLKYGVTEKRIYHLLKEGKDTGLITQEIVKGQTRGQKYHAI